jgi:hypothetical protein
MSQKFRVIVAPDGEILNDPYGPGMTRAIERYTDMNTMSGHYCVRLASGNPVAYTVEQLRSMLAIAELWEAADAG